MHLEEKVKVLEKQVQENHEEMKQYREIITSLTKTLENVTLKKEEEKTVELPEDSSADNTETPSDNTEETEKTAANSDCCVRNLHEPLTETPDIPKNNDTVTSTVSAKELPSTTNSRDDHLFLKQSDWMMKNGKSETVMTKYMSINSQPQRSDKCLEELRWERELETRRTKNTEQTLFSSFTETCKPFLYGWPAKETSSKPDIKIWFEKPVPQTGKESLDGNSATAKSIAPPSAITFSGPSLFKKSEPGNDFLVQYDTMTQAGIVKTVKAKLISISAKRDDKSIEELRLEHQEKNRKVPKTEENLFASFNCTSSPFGAFSATTSAAKPDMSKSPLGKRKPEARKNVFPTTPGSAVLEKTEASAPKFTFSKPWVLKKCDGEEDFHVISDSWMRNGVQQAIQAKFMSINSRPEKQDKCIEELRLEHQMNSKKNESATKNALEASTENSAYPFPFACPAANPRNKPATVSLLGKPFPLKKDESSQQKFTNEKDATAPLLQFGKNPELFTKKVDTFINDLNKCEKDKTVEEKKSADKPREFSIFKQLSTEKSSVTMKKENTKKTTADSSKPDSINGFPPFGQSSYFIPVESFQGTAAIKRNSATPSQTLSMTFGEPSKLLQKDADQSSANQALQITPAPSKESILTAVEHPNSVQRNLAVSHRGDAKTNVEQELVRRARDMYKLKVAEDHLEKLFINNVQKCKGSKDTYYMGQLPKRKEPQTILDTMKSKSDAQDLLLEYLQDEVHKLRKHKEDTEVVISGKDMQIKYLKERVAALEESLQSENKLKQDLFRALGDARQHNTHLRDMTRLQNEFTLPEAGDVDSTSVLDWTVPSQTIPLSSRSLFHHSFYSIPNLFPDAQLNNITPHGNNLLTDTQASTSDLPPLLQNGPLIYFDSPAKKNPNN